MAGDNYRFSLSAEKYLEQHHVLTYLEDAISQLLEHKDDNPKVNPTKFFSEYFTSVREGNHTLFRDYSFIRSTPHNRASFVKAFWKCFRHIGWNGDLLSSKEYHSLLGLICSDFPFSVVQKTAKIILLDDATDCLISFSDFLYAFQVQFCYDEFLVECADVYKALLRSPTTALPETVVVPTSETSADGGVHNDVAESVSLDGVDAMQYFRALLPVTEKQNVNAPSVSLLREVLSAADRVTFYGFLFALAKSEKINECIGKLPSKSELLAAPEPEVTTKVPANQHADEKPTKHESSASQSAATKQRPASAQSRPQSARTNNSQTNGDLSEKLATASRSAGQTEPRRAAKPKRVARLPAYRKKSLKDTSESERDADDDDDDDSDDDSASTND